MCCSCIKRQGIFNNRRVTHFSSVNHHTISVSSLILGIPKHFFLISNGNYLMCIKGSPGPFLLSLSNSQVLSEEELCYPISHNDNTNPSHRDKNFTSPLGMALSAHFAPKPGTSVSCHVPSPQLLSSPDHSPELFRLMHSPVKLSQLGLHGTEK